MRISNAKIKHYRLKDFQPTEPQAEVSFESARGMTVGFLYNKGI